MPNLISTGLFGDRAAAAFVVDAEWSSVGPIILGTYSVFDADSEDIRCGDISEKGIQTVLSARPPKLIQQRLADDVDRFLTDLGLSRSDIGNRFIHAGGTEIPEAIEVALGLSDCDLRLPWECLRRHGSISTARE